MEAVGYVENASGPGEMFLEMRAKARGSMEDDSQISHPHIGMTQNSRALGRGGEVARERLESRTVTRGCGAGSKQVMVWLAQLCNRAHTSVDHLHWLWASTSTARLILAYSPSHGNCTSPFYSLCDTIVIYVDLILSTSCLRVSIRPGTFIINQHV